MKLPSKIKFIDERLLKSFNKLKENKKEQNLYKSLIKAFKEIETNAFIGIQIPKKLIPKDYSKKYKMHNLWKYNLPNAWRLLYSVENQEIIIVSIILEWLPHKEYEKRFNY